MQRRKLLATIGSLAAGSAAAVGTGAFTSVSADRSVSVEVTGDDDAFLRLAGTGSANSDAFVDTSGDQVAFDFSAANGNVAGDGFNAKGVTVVDQLLRVANLGTQQVQFYVDFANIDLSDGNGGQAYIALQTVSVGDTGNPTNAGNRNANENHNVAVNSGAENIEGSYSGFNGSNALSDFTPEARDLGVGEVIELDLIVDTRDFDPPSGTSLPLGTSGPVEFVADQDGI